MSKRNHLFTTSALTVLLACSVACAQENSPATTKAKANDKSEHKEHSEKSQTDIPAQKNKGNEQAKQDLPKEEIVKVSEAFGHFIGRNLKNPGLQFDLDSIIKGMRSGYAGDPAPLSDQEYEELMAKLQEKAYNQVAQDNLKAAEEYLAKNTKEKNVVELVPGQLQYIVLEEGKGSTVGQTDLPLINYTGLFIDGSKFGSSEESGGPITVPLDQTIPGFSKGILGMKEGEKRRLFVHPTLGYGTTGHLPPNSLLIFDVEVIKANAQEEQPQDDKNPELSLNDKANSKNSSDTDKEADDEDEDDGDDDDDTDDDMYDDDNVKDRKVHEITVPIKPEATTK